MKIERKPDTRKLGIIGARGYVGAELLGLIENHPRLSLAFASSRSLEGQSIGGISYEALDPQAVASRDAEVVVLAMPNGYAQTYVDAMEAAGNDALLIDLGADYRFDSDWHYGLPELYGGPPPGCRRISNPGCYATAMQLALYPLRERLAAAPACFGVSGYSGAGTQSSEKNDPDVLADNLLPYAPIAHVHEREVGRHLGHPVHFMPHVASFFRGIGMTFDLTLDQSMTADSLYREYLSAYRDCPLVAVSAEAPRVRDLAGTPGASVGGFACDGQRVVVYSALDNLLKGAAVQALQNINLALGFEELMGIDHA